MNPAIADVERLNHASGADEAAGSLVDFDAVIARLGSNFR